MIKTHMMVDQFGLEVKLQMYLNHENILTLFNVFDDKTSLYLVLEYMDEGTLFAHLKKHKKLPEPEVAVKIKEIASAIKYLHENQIAHRDIKPENIVMSHVKVPLPRASASSAISAGPQSAMRGAKLTAAPSTTLLLRSSRGPSTITQSTCGVSACSPMNSW